MIPGLIINFFFVLVTTERATPALFDRDITPQQQNTLFNTSHFNSYGFLSDFVVPIPAFAYLGTRICPMESLLETNRG